MRKISGLIAVLTLVVVLSSCGGGSSPPGPPPPPPPPPPPANCTTGTFCMGSDTYYTATGTTSATLGVNATVTWDNNSGGIQHDVVFDTPAAALAVGNGSAGNIPLHTQGMNQRRFAAAGSFPFHCTVHGTQTSGMRGTVVIQ
jgi:plastocyanin